MFTMWWTGRQAIMAGIRNQGCSSRSHVSRQLRTVSSFKRDRRNYRKITACPLKVNEIVCGNISWGEIESIQFEKVPKTLTTIFSCLLVRKSKKRSKNVIHLIMYKFIYLQHSIDITLKYVILTISRNMVACENWLPCEIYLCNTRCIIMELKVIWKLEICWYFLGSIFQVSVFTLHFI